eukprot:g13755.t1
MQETREDTASNCLVRMLVCQQEGAAVWRGPQIVVPWWRDQSEPPLDHFLELDKLLDSFLDPGKSHCVLVHCAGGIGRAGVFVAADSGARAACQGKVSSCSPDRPWHQIAKWSWHVLYASSKRGLENSYASEMWRTSQAKMHEIIRQDFACFQMTDGLQTHRLLPDATQLAMLEEKWAKLKAATTRASHLLFKRRFISFDETLKSAP